MKDIHKTCHLLPKEFTGSGEVKDFLFSQIDSNEHGYIYKVIAGRKTFYEVIKRVIVEKFNFDTNENTGEFKETYPKAKHFGLLGWSFYDIELAKDKLSKLSEIKDDSDEE